MLRFDELFCRRYVLAMPIASDVRDVQTCYPQIYLACHVDHKRARSTSSGITPREASLLAHLDETRPKSASQLARHFRVGAPSMSALLKRLRLRGLIRVERGPEDTRQLAVFLTEAGTQAIADASVLDTARVALLLKRLAPDERRRALDGLRLLARAARELGDAHGW